MKNPALFSKLLEWQVYTALPFLIIATVLSIIMLYFLYRLKKNRDYILKMKIYEFEKNNPEKPFSEIINDRYAFIRVKF